MNSTWKRIERWLGEPLLSLSSAAGRYLTRWCKLSTWLLTVYVHRIDGPDPDPDCHNHPWEALVIVLRKPGAYTQHLQKCTGGPIRVERVGRFNFLGAGFHRVVDVAPGTWTLCICGPRRARGWGFSTPMGYVDWDTYVNDPNRTVKAAVGVVSGIEMGGR